MRNRMIKPEFWQSKTLRKCSLEARLLFIGLWNFCDDYGVCLDSNRKILGEVFPFDENISEKRLEKWKNELITNKLVIPVEYDSTKYLIIRSWFEHQIVPNPSKRRYLDEEVQEKLMRDYLESNETLNNSQLSKEKEKEKEKENKKVKEKAGEINPRLETLIKPQTSNDSNSDLPLPLQTLNDYLPKDFTEEETLLSVKRLITDFLNINQPEKSSLKAITNIILHTKQVKCETAFRFVYETFATIHSLPQEKQNLAYIYKAIKGKIDDALIKAREERAKMLKNEEKKINPAIYPEILTLADKMKIS